MPASTQPSDSGTAAQFVPDDGVGRPATDESKLSRESATKRTRATSAVRSSLSQFSILLVFPLVFITVWVLVVQLEFFDQAFLPGPLAVLAALWDWLFGGSSATPYSNRWLSDALASARRVLLGYTIGCGLGIIIGVLLGHFPMFRRIVEPYIHVLRAIPIIGWLPLALVFFGFGIQAAVFLVGLGCFFPVVVNTMSGVLGVDQSHMRVGHMVGANRRQQMVFIILPAAMPSILTGLRVAMGFAWILVIVAEWLAVRDGLGHVLLDAYSFVRYEYVIAAMISIGFVGFVSDRAVYRLLSPLVKWHQDTTMGK